MSAGTHARRGRIWLLRIVVMVAAPAAALLLLELVLRVVGFGHPTSFFVPIDGGPQYTTNLHYGLRFFPAHLARWPVPCVLEKAKPPGVYRVFVVGGSAAQGMPDQSFAFCRVLQVMLETAYPQQRFEVINAAMTAINSHVVREIVRDCAGFEPDLFVVYMGNNEVVGPYGPGTVFAGFLENQSMIRLSIAVRRLRMAQLIETLASSMSSRQAWRGMEMFVPHRVPAHDPRLRQTYQYLRANVQDIIDAANTAGADVVACTVATNLTDCPPFMSVHRPGISPTQLADWQIAFDRGAALEANGDCEEAIEQYQQAMAIDDAFAELRYRLGRCYLGLSRTADAHRLFVEARDLDALRFRADSQVNGILRQAGAITADVARALPNAGHQWLYEHVHMNFAGNYEVAKSIFESIAHLLGEPDAALPDVRQCAAQLGLTDWHRWNLATLMREMTARAPFTLQLGHEADQARQRAQLAALKNALDNSVVMRRMIAQSAAAMDQRSDDLQLRRQLALLLTHAGDNHRAAQLWQGLLERVPGWAPWQGELGKVLTMLGRENEAIAILRDAVSTMPHDTALLTNLGVALVKVGRLDEAQDVLQRSLALEPDHLATLNNLGLVLSALGRFDEALPIYRRAVELDANNANLHCSLGLLYREMGDRAKAQQHIKKALAIRPGHEMATQALDDIMQP